MKKHKKVGLTEEEQINYSKELSIKEGSAYSLMDGFGLRYISPYAIALNVSNSFIGLLSTIPPLIGNIFQLHTIKLMKKRSRKAIITYSTLLQSLLWLPIISIGIVYFFFKIDSLAASILLLVTYTSMIIAGSVSGPAWSSWMKDLVKENSGKYFGKRNKIVGAIALVSMLIAGFILDYFKQINVFIGFSIIFTIAFLGRFVSSRIFIKKYEPPLHYEETSYFTFRQFLKKMPSNNFGKFVIFVSLISLATAIASPFFAVYMLKDLNLSYMGFTLATLSSAFTTILFMPFWGKFADSYGNIKVIKLTSSFIPLIPVLWLFSVFVKSFGLFLLAYLLLIEGFSGFVWSGFNLSAGNFIYDAVTRQRMALCVAYFNIINAFGAFIGASIGGLIASKTFNIFGLSSLLFIFVLSALVRFVVMISIGEKIKEVRQVKEIKIKKHLKEKIKANTLTLGKYIGFKPLRVPPTIN